MSSNKMAYNKPIHKGQEAIEYMRQSQESYKIMRAMVAKKLEGNRDSQRYIVEDGDIMGPKEVQIRAVDTLDELNDHPERVLSGLNQ